MDLVESLKMATTTILSNKLRSSLTILGIVIGNASVIAMVGIGQGAQKYAAQQFESLGPNLLFVTGGSSRQRRTTFDLPRTLVLADAEAIASQVPAVKSVAPQVQNQQIVTYSSDKITTLTIGTTPEFLTVRDFTVDKGRFINDIDIKRANQVVVLGSYTADRLFGNQDPIGKKIRVKNLTFEVIGFMKSKGSFLGNNQDDSLFIPITTMANRIVGRSSPYGLLVTSIAMSAKDQNSISAAQFQVQNLLRLRHKITGDDDFEINTQADILGIINAITGALTLMLAAIAAISLLVGGIGVMNIMLVSVTERTQEIGLRKAIGATQSNILTQFLIEAIILSAAGGLIGTLLGVGGLAIIAALTPFEVGASPVVVVVAVSISGAIGLFFGVVPARRAAALDPIVALRSA
ncbi:ABC transporter permease [Merismopedia glauca]|uniref:ABC transporter permease n=1 Tax=Merismopedia glauca CCAP 1448/3 TaxID=1296344 RepID=A0A2T1BX14_9CYAN|nr:ABC transporter permease [Merismopedia glauca]PSB00532.1 ABC transporter permease [Merismopedia glauca CCAP 1448/3]